MRRLSIPAISLALVLLAPFAFASDCKPAPTDEHMRFSLAENMLVQMPLGSTRKFQIGESRPPGPEHESLGDICAQWRTDPEIKGVSVSENGVLTVSPAAPPNQTFELLAKMTNGREVRVYVHIYDKAQHPLAGMWKQDGGERCPKADSPVTRQAPIQELVLRTDGWFTVTWQPFETYVDYAGKYRVGGKRISFTIDRGNFKPKFFRGDGTFRLLDPKHLEFSGIYFGNRNDSEVLAGMAQRCRYVFVKVAEPE